MAARKTAGGVVDRFRDLAKVMWLIAALRVVNALTTPVTAASAPFDQLLASTILLIGHGFVYHFGALMRRKKGPVPYLAIQATLAASIALFSLSIWVTIVLFAALGAHAFVLLRDRPAAALVATASLLGFAISTSLGWGLPRGIALALILGAVGVAVASLTGANKRR